MFQQASIKDSHVAVCNVSLNFTPTAVAPECLLVLGAIKLFYLGFLKCPASFLHLFYEFKENHSESTLMSFSKDMSLPVECCLSTNSTVVCTHLDTVEDTKHIPKS